MCRIYKKKFQKYKGNGCRRRDIWWDFLIGLPPIPVAYEDNYVIIPYSKPCYGMFVLKIKLDEINKDKKEKKKSKKGLLSKLKFW